MFSSGIEQTNDGGRKLPTGDSPMKLSRRKRMIKEKRLGVSRLLTGLLMSVVLVSGETWVEPANIVPIAEGYAESAVNTTIFRRNSVVTFQGHQFAAFYDPKGRVVLAMRQHGTDDWKVRATRYRGAAEDSHNVVNIMVDGDGYLHMAWDHHSSPLRYARSVEPLSLKMGEPKAMIGTLEDRVTYPEFHRLPSGDLIFVYRDGVSGRGNVVVNRYHVPSRTWARLHDNLIDGEGHRNAYWQVYVDHAGTIHLSWVWRETANANTNHDLCYARSKDGGLSWETSRGKEYEVPIRERSAELVSRVPQGANLINQTDMTADGHGAPFIATYFRARDDQCTQIHVFFLRGGRWERTTVTDRRLDFELGGQGSLRLPLSRPVVVFERHPVRPRLHVIYRDDEFGGVARVASAEIDERLSWHVSELTDRSLGAWEPSYDTELWESQQTMHLFLQQTQGWVADRRTGFTGSPVSILEVDALGSERTD